MHNISMEDVLLSREKRVERQKGLLRKYKGATIISYTINIMGPVKIIPLSIETFYEGRMYILRQLKRNNIEVTEEKIYEEKTGYEGYFVVKEDGGFIKKLMVEIEEGLPLGRIFDIDIIDIDGKKVSRKDTGLEERKCIICDNLSPICARNRSHSLEILLKKVTEIMKEYFHNKKSDEISSYAINALLYEVNISPKPGLVDRYGNGSHKDMDIFTFIDTISYLSPYFKECTFRGLLHDGAVDEMLPKIRFIGKEAESLMLEKTKGINTHKGLIFSLGILSMTIGYIYANGYGMTLENISKVSKEMSKETINEINQRENSSTGITGGARGEASSGFITAIKYGVPIIKNGAEKGFEKNSTGIIALFNILAHTKDTNIINRASEDELIKIQEKLKKIIAEELTEEEIIEKANRLNKEFIDKNISPGGAADILAISYFLYLIG